MLKHNRRASRARRLYVEWLEPRLYLDAGPLLITEFVASNQNGLGDEDGQCSDWIEVHNPTAAAVNLNGWHLTDKPDDLSEWTFPDVSLEPGGYLVVFASGKDRRDPAHPLHSNFKLDNNGEYLALVQPDGGTIASSYAPQFPRQKDDVSYGLPQQITPLVAAGAAAAVLVPPSGDMGTSWTAEGFNETAWPHGPTGVGFETGPAQLPVIAYSDNAGNVGSQAWGGPLGMDFYVHKPITVTQLGVFDSGSDGLRRTLTAQMWTRNGNTGTLLAQLSFTPADPGALVGGNRFKTLAAPLVLPQGDYTVAAYGYGSDELNGNTGGPAYSQKNTNDGNGAIEFEGLGRYSNTPGAFPATPDGGPVNRYSAGTFQFLVPAYTDLVRTNIQATMYGVNSSVYTRIVFTGADAAAFSSLSLQMKYDDGFVAYLNGTEVARRNAPSPFAWNSSATGAHAADQAVVYENINIRSFLGLLHPGTNVLAIQGLNAAAGDGDFLLLPQLIAAGVPGTQSRYFDSPTPGGPNNSSSSFVGFVDELQFSVGRGFFQSPFDVSITSATAGARIYCTLNGTEPSPTNGTLYQGPVHVATTTVLRAAGFEDGFVPTTIKTETYLFLDAVVNQTNAPSGYPTTWNGYTPDYGMSQNSTDLPLIAGNASYTVAQARQVIKNSLLALPTMSIALPPGSLFDPTTGIYVNPTGRDDAWERSASIEYLLPDGSPGFQINGGLQIEGNTSRNLGMSPKLSFRIVFKKPYGPAALDYPFFPGSSLHHYNTLALRCNTRDSWLYATNSDFYDPRSHALLIRDQWAKVAQAAMDEPATAGRFVHLYINGMYWGIYNPTERPDADFAADHLGGSPEDYDVVKFCSNTVVDGDMTKWNQLLSLAAAGLGTDAQYQYIQGNNPDGTRNPNYDVLIDIDNFIDYVINGQYHANFDWPGNFYVIRKRGPDSTGFKFLTWDNDLGFPYEDVNFDKTRPLNPGEQYFFWWDTSPGRIDRALRANAEYRLRFADHVQRQFFNGGSLTAQAAASRWTEIATQVQPALAAESARWGDYRRDVSPQGGERMLYTPTQWQAVSNLMLSNYFPNRTNVVLGQLRNVGLYPSLAAPSLNQFGGSIASGFNLTMTAASGAIYYTLDGSDPRLAGGAVHGTRYTSAITLRESTRVKARVLSGATWSALVDTVFLVDGRARAGSIVLTEVNYSPSQPIATEQAAGFTDPDAFEFIELTNTSATATLDLHGLSFTNGVSFDFNTAALTSLAPGQRLVVVRNPAAFAARHGGSLPVAGTYTGGLDNGGERITLEDANTGIIADFTYSDSGRWPSRADGQGSSLELVSISGTYNDPANWQSSADYNGSPGRAPIAPDVVINEVLSHSDAPQVDAIELYNTSANPLDLGGWYLSDSTANYLNFRIPDNTVIAGHGYLVFQQGHWVAGQLQYAANEFGGAFGLNGAHGNDVYLVQGDAAGRPLRFADHADFGAMAAGQTYGRWQDSEGRWHFVPMLRPTLTAPDNANATGGNGPNVGPIIVSEMMYAPKPLTMSEMGVGFSTPEDMEFIEIYNPTSAAVTLTSWRLDKAVTYAFAAGSSLASGATLIVAPFDPARSAMLTAFRARYGIGSTVAVVGPYSGHLDNSGDKVKLQRPDTPPVDEPDYDPMLLEDEADYRTTWGANGDGDSLQRLSIDAWGDSKASWGAAAASPGTVSLVVGRHVFYNNSAFDGRNPGADAADDLAIGIDKTPLLPGHRASFENYTSYSRGINGLMVDLGSPSGTVVVGDFTFRVSDASNPPNWTAIATLPTVTTRSVSGVTRVTLIWPDNTIQNQWLEVTVRSGAGTHTGLAAQNVFYFGNAIGETGNHAMGDTADAVTDAADEAAVRANNNALPAAANNPYDFNHDRRVNATDELLARANCQTAASALKLIDLTGTAQGLPAGVAATGTEARPVDTPRVAASACWSSVTITPNLQASRPSKTAVGPTLRPRQAVSSLAAAHDAILAALDTVAAAKSVREWAWIWAVQQSYVRQSPGKSRGWPGDAISERLDYQPVNRS